MKTRARTLILRDGSILLVHRWKSGAEYYVVPGGGVEEGETIEAGVAREMFEETGLRGTPGRLVYEDYDGHRERHCFFLVTDAVGTPTFEHAASEQRKMSEENRYALEWVPLSAIESIPLVPRELIPILLQLEERTRFPA